MQNSDIMHSNIFSDTWLLLQMLSDMQLSNNNNNNNNPIYKAPKALASEALVAGQSWVLIKSLTEEIRLKSRFKDRQ